MSSVPVAGVVPQLLRALADGNAAVLVAPPGAGKTTAVPPALLDAPWAEGGKILLLEPRRLAARAAAAFMSRQRGESVGSTVGYRVQLDTRVGPCTRIEVVTDGVLVRMLQEDPELTGYAAVIFDEYHERSLLADLGLALALDAQQALRPDLRLLVMSATLEAERVSALLGGAPLIESRGRSYPVEIVEVASPPNEAPLSARMAEAIRRALAEQGGSLLAFLPGQRDIRLTMDRLQAQVPADVRVLPLYGEMHAEAQDAAIAPADPGTRKVVLATNIAESSLTIDGIRIVVDSGLERRLRLDPVSGMSRLVTGRISRASAEQRSGRAGRLSAGVCYRLWSRDQHLRLRPFSLPEMLEADLAPLVLELAIWGVSDPAQLRWLDMPPEAAWEQARDLLGMLGAVDAEGTATARGRGMAGLGVHPRLAHMLLDAQQRGWGWMACLLAAVLSDRDPLSGAQDRQSDIGVRLSLFRSRPRQGRLQRVWMQAERLATRLGVSPGGEVHGDPGLLVALAYPDRIALRRAGQEPRYLLAGGRGARMDREDGLAQTPMLAVAAVDGEARESRIFLAAVLDSAAFAREFRDRIAVRDQIELDDATGRVTGRRQHCFGALVLEEAVLPRPAPEAIAAVLLDEIRRRGMGLLPWTPALRQWQARVLLLGRMVPEQGWPDVSDDTLLATLETWLAPYLAGCEGLNDLKRMPLRQALQAMLGYPLSDQLRRLAPEDWPLPAGRRGVIDYCSGDAPVLAVRMQDMCGCRETPTIADGRVPLVLHLLSPADRPVQVTRDLAGFWAGSYAEVRKDMRGRYPKHRWPEDPASAEPGRHTARRRAR
ncbi:MAG: ATP-dependent helicase HrpB [Ectothiorhodospiraceae bacterium]|nr:ATP-dependent helicase HrpB [Ectothiorhodospiraceae bacterium]